MTETNGTLKVGGALTFSALAEWTVRSTLEAGLQRLGYLEYLPEARSNTACLRDALGEVFTERNVEIKPCEEAGTFEIIRIKKGKSRNSYDHLHTCSVDDQRAITLSPFAADTAEKIAQEFNAQLGYLRAYAVTQALTGILQSLGGTSLRPKGALYWVPPAQVDLWEQVALAVDGSGHPRSSAVYVIRHQMDAGSLRAVRDGILREVFTRSKEIKEEVLSVDNPLGARGLAHRQEEAQDLREKVTAYEGLLNIGLDSLKDVLAEVETTIGQAGLLAAGAVA